MRLMPYQIKLSSVRNAEATYVRLNPYIVEGASDLTPIYSPDANGRGQAALQVVSRVRVSSRS